MASGNGIPALALAATLLVAFFGVTTPGAAAFPTADSEAVAGPGSLAARHDVLIKPQGWLGFDQACVFGSRFGVVLDRSKRTSGRAIVRKLTGWSGGLERPALPAALGLDCVPYSVGFD